MTPEEKRKRILELNLKMRARQKSEADAAAAKKSPSLPVPPKKMQGRVGDQRTPEDMKKIAAIKERQETLKKARQAIRARLETATAKKRIQKAILARVMAKKANKKNPFQDIIDEWKDGSNEGFDDGFNPQEGVDELVQRVKDGKKNAVMLQANYSNYGGTGSGGGYLLDGLREAYARAKPSFGLKFTDVKDTIKWGNKQSVVKGLEIGNLSALAENLENRDDDEDIFDEPSYYGRTKIEVMFDTPEKKAEAIDFFAKLAD